MGFLSQYQDRGPTAREVFEAMSRLRDAMLYDWRRNADPQRTVFTGARHAEALRRALNAAEPACAVIELPTFILDDGVFVLDGRDEPVRICADHIKELAAAIESGESPQSAVLRLAAVAGQESLVSPAGHPPVPAVRPA